MSEVTDKEIEDAIKNCYWLSQNRPGKLIEDICTGEVAPCERVIESGKCDTLKDLFRKHFEEENNGKVQTQDNEG